MSFTYSPSFSYFTLTDPAGIPATTVSVDGDIRIKFYPVWYKQVTLEWSIPPFWGDCSFNIYRSYSPEGEFIKMNATPILGNSFRDAESQAFNKFSHDYYIVEVILPTGSTIRSPATTMENTRKKSIQLKAMDIQRREYILLSKFTGVNSILFKRRTYGKRCSLCWNEDIQKSMDDNCPSCLGTSFEGGFFPGVNCYVQYESTPDTLARTYFGKFQASQIAAWTISYPDIASHDVLLRIPDWKMYHVDGITSTELQTVSVRQIMQLVELDKSSVEYNLCTRDTEVFPTEYQ